jgi:uncharacterized protein YndB with AHSA1/START domain
MKTIKKTIGVHAPKAKVWDVLLQDQFTRIWYAEFSPGAYAETDWQLGSKAVFSDDSQDGLVGKIVANQPCELVSIAYEGLLLNGKEDYEPA